MLEAAAVAGFTSAGADVLLLGVVPTPTVAHVVAAGAADVGLVISASHNAMPDNGLKLFGPGGHKLTDAQEDAIEAGLDDVTGVTGPAVGQVRPAPDTLLADYLNALQASAGPLAGLRVVVDAAEGAAGPVPRSWPSTRTGTVGASTTGAAPPTQSRWRLPSSRTGLIWESPTTGMPIAASWSMAQGRC
jgi:phosphomannomutase